MDIFWVYYQVYTKVFIHMFLPVVLIFLPVVFILETGYRFIGYMFIWQATSCQQCQLRLNHRTDHIYLTTVPLLSYNIVETYILVWFPYNMLLVRRSDGDWQLTKSPLHEVYMWSVFVYCSLLLIPTLTL